MTWSGETKVENDLRGVENAPGSGFVKKHSPLQGDPVDLLPHLVSQSQGEGKSELFTMFSFPIC